MRRLINCITACGWGFWKPVDVAGSILSRLKKLLLVVGVIMVMATSCGGPGANERFTPTPDRYVLEELRREAAQALSGLCLEMFAAVGVGRDHVELLVSDWEFVEQELRKAGRTLPPGVVVPGKGPAFWRRFPPPTVTPVPGVSLVQLKAPPVYALTAAFGGKLVISDGCVSLEDGETRVLIWPPGYYLTQGEDAVEILDYRGNVIARVGDRVKIGGGEAPPGLECALREPVPPCVQRKKALLVSDISKFLRIDGVLEKQDPCWRLRTEEGEVYHIVWTGGPSREKEDEVTYGEFEEREGRSGFVPRVTFRVGDRVHVEGVLRRRWWGRNVSPECPGPYLVVDSIRHVEER